MERLAITTKRLYICQMTEDDFETVADLLKEGKIATSFLSNPKYVESLIKGVWLDITKAENYNALIFLQESNTFCGRICLQDISEPCPALGIELLKAYQNQGIGPEAIIPFLNCCAKMMDIKRVRVRIWQGNTHSIHVFEKMGAVADGVKPYYSEKILDHIAEAFGEQEIEELKAPTVCEYHFDLPIKCQRSGTNKTPASAFQV